MGMLSPSLKLRSDPVGKRMDLLRLECGWSEVALEGATEYVLAAPSMVDLAVVRQARDRRGRMSTSIILAELKLEIRSCHGSVVCTYITLDD